MRNAVLDNCDFYPNGKVQCDIEDRHCDRCGWNPKVDAARRQKSREEIVKKGVVCERCGVRLEPGDEYAAWGRETYCADCIKAEVADAIQGPAWSKVRDVLADRLLIDFAVMHGPEK